jgi:quinolinate synthase
MTVAKFDSSSETVIPRDLPAAIRALKQQKNAVILAHYYQEPAIQDLADYIGDSLGLSQQAAGTQVDMIVFAGVVFMAETAKILNPTKKVVLPDLQAGCSLADNCPPDKFRSFIAEHPGHTVISYINCSAEVKALSDIICTSSNAEKIVRSIPADQPIIFAPDRYLGGYLIKKTGRPMVLWNGSCQVHEVFDAKKLVQLKARHPEAEIIAHPECPEAVLDLADFIGSTTALLKYAQTSMTRQFIVVTERGIMHQMQKACPDKIFYSPPSQAGSCSCAECPFMRLNTVAKLYQCLADETPEITLAEDLRLKALRPIERMLELSGPM